MYLSSLSITFPLGQSNFNLMYSCSIYYYCTHKLSKVDKDFFLTGEMFHLREAKLIASVGTVCE